MIKQGVLVFVLIFFFSCTKNKLHHNFYKGEAFGTTFSVQFIDHNKLDLSHSYDSLVAVINNSMSTYIDSSDISKINKGDTTVLVDQHFAHVFNISEKIYNETQGVFDPTIGVLVNAWDFGPEGKINGLDSLKIDSLLMLVGLDKVILEKNKIKKTHAAIYLDFNALAKGYAVDVFSSFLEHKGIENYLVEIGGEIRSKGSNSIKQKPWLIGVENPNFDDTQSYSKVISLHNESMATSGSYRKYKVDEEGKKYAHIINPKTGYPHRSNLLSVSILAPTCIEADAYATALMSMGLQQAKQFLEHHKELKAYLIYEDVDNELKTQAINNFPEN